MTERLLTRDALAHFSGEEIVVGHEGHEDNTAGELIVPKFPTEEIDVEQQGSSGSETSNDQ